MCPLWAQSAGTIGRRTRPVGLELREGLVVAIPDREAPLGDRVGLLQLRPEERRDDLARQVRRAEVDPGVLVDLAAEELAPVGALLPDDLGALDEPRVVDERARRPRRR